MKIKALLLGGALLFAASVSFASEMVTVNLQARVTEVIDDFGILGSEVAAGQSVNGSYTYDASVPDQEGAPNYGYYPQPSGSTQFSLGSLIFETSPGSSYGHAVATHPSDYPGYYQGFLRVQSMVNKPLTNGANVSYIEIEFSDYSGYAPASEALPLVAPDLQSFPVHRAYLSGDLNGQWFHIVLEIESAQTGYNDSELIVSPGDSTFLQQQRFDVALVVPPGSEVVRVQAKNGESILPVGYPDSCALTASPSDGRTAILCSDAHFMLPSGSGTQHIEWEVELMDGRVLRNAVDWKVLQQ